MSKVCVLVCGTVFLLKPIIDMWRSICLGNEEPILGSSFSLEKYNLEKDIK